MVAVLLASLGTWLTGLYIQKLEQQASGQGPRTQVVVARSAIPKGTELEHKLVESRMWPAALVPHGAVGDIEAVLGQFSSIDLAPGEVIFSSRLLGREEQGLVWQLNAGERAVSVPVSRIGGLEAELSPGSQVDILGTLIDYRTGLEHSLLVLENVTLLELVADDDPYSGVTGKQTVVLAVSPNEAKKLALFGNSGSLQLLLRPAGLVEHHLSNDIALTTRDILGHESHQISLGALEPPAVERLGAAQGPSGETLPSWQVEVIKGTASSVEMEEVLRE